MCKKVLKRIRLYMLLYAGLETVYIYEVPFLLLGGHFFLCSDNFLWPFLSDVNFYFLVVVLLLYCFALEKYLIAFFFFFLTIFNLLKKKIQKILFVNISASRFDFKKQSKQKQESCCIFRKEPDSTFIFLCLFLCINDDELLS